MAMSATAYKVFHLSATRKRLEKKEAEFTFDWYGEGKPVCSQFFAVVEGRTGLEGVCQE
jgi:hypothetical protein